MGNQSHSGRIGAKEGEIHFVFDNPGVPLFFGGGGGREGGEGDYLFVSMV